MSTALPGNRLGIDFGTSNSAAGILVNNKPYLIEIETGQKTLPTSVFFDFSDRTVLFGTAAGKALIEGKDGRFMRSLKSVLGTSLMHERRQIMGESLTFVDIIGRFLEHIKRQAETACHRTFDYALSGRPVHFHSSDTTKDNQALIDLRECYHVAGFKGVDFVHEPEAAAIANASFKNPTEIGLIVDIGGGTSDFSLFRADNSDRYHIQILASHGVRVGGTNFDQSISVDHVMPLFGKGSQLRNEFGPGRTTAPNSIFQDLATWEKIPFLYTAESKRNVAQMQKIAVEKRLFDRLSGILRDELGHDVAFAVERGKIQANRAVGGSARINLGIIESGLDVPLTPSDLSVSLSNHAERIRNCAKETLEMANCSEGDVKRVIMVGGSSLMGVVEQAMSDLFPKADIQFSDAFTAIVDGLAIATEKP